MSGPRTSPSAELPPPLVAPPRPAARPVGWGRRLSLAPTTAWAVLAVAADVLHARRALARHRDVRDLLASLTPAAPPRARRPDAATVHRLYRGVAWAIRLAPHRSVGTCLYAALALYRALRRRGIPASFVSGVRRDPGHVAGPVAGHAWVELGDQVLDPAGGTDHRGYAVTLRYPAG